MNRKFLFALCGLSMFATSAAFADGSHSVKIDITSEINQDIEIAAYNGKDTNMTIPHKVYYVGNGGTRTVKCHGQGKHKCYVAIKIKGTSKYLYLDAIKDNSTCAITNDSGSFGWFDDAQTNKWKGYNNLNCD